MRTAADGVLADSCRSDKLDLGGSRRGVLLQHLTELGLGAGDIAAGCVELAQDEMCRHR